MKKIISAVLAVFMILTAIPFCTFVNESPLTVSSVAASAKIYKVTLNNGGATSAGTKAYWYKYNTVKNGVYYYLNSDCTTAMKNYTITRPAKTGYTFKGYFTETNGKGTQYVDANGKCINNLYKKTGSRTLYACWEANTYKVTLDNCGATMGATAAYWYKYNTVNNGIYYYLNSDCTIAMIGYSINCPTKTGYTFKGYFTEMNGKGTQYVDANGKCINNLYKKTGNRTLYAYWTVATYKVTLDNCGATSEGTTAYWYKYNTSSKGIYYYLNSDCTTPMNNYTITCPKRTDYVFKGYFTEKNGKGTQYVDANGKCINNIYKIAGNKTLYACWQFVNSGKIVYDDETDSITVKNKNGTDTGLLGYKYSIKDHVFYTAEDSWQRNFGFTEVYDKAAALGTMTYNTIRVRFNYGGEDWMIQFWKGQYGLMFIGAEVGVYTRPEGVSGSTFYNCADDDHKLWMTMDFYRQNALNKNKYDHVFTRSRSKTWWCTGFIPGTLGLGQLNIPDENGTAKLKVDTRIEFKDEAMAQAFINSLSKIYYIENNSALSGSKRGVTFYKFNTEKEYDASSASCKYMLCDDGTTVRVCYR